MPSYESVRSLQPSRGHLLTAVVNGSFGVDLLPDAQRVTAGLA